MLTSWFATGFGRACVRLLACSVAWVWSQAAISQCVPAHWATTFQPLGTNGEVRAFTEWDPDGAGPLPAEMVIAGAFTMAGGSQASRVARWSGTSWSSFPSTSLPIVRALAVLPTGELVIGVETSGAPGVYRWDGAGWVPLGGANASVQGPVYALRVLANGDLLAAGNFTTVDGMTVNRIARWNGSAWSALGAGLPGVVNSVTELATGEIVAGGTFASLGNVASWNGSTWVRVGAGLNGGTNTVNSVVTLSNGRVAAAGTFTFSGPTPVPGVAQWDGVAWAPMGSIQTTNGVVLEATSNGGAFITGNGLGLRHWDGVTWTQVTPSPGGAIWALHSLADGSLLVGGGFSTITLNPGVLQVNNVARWRDSEWTGFGGGLTGPVDSIVPLSSGEVIVAGEFDAAGGRRMARLARWSGSEWTRIGSGSIAGDVYAARVLSNGDLIIGGTFSSVDGLAANRIARWNGVEWSALGAGFDNSVGELLELPNGDLIAAGSFTQSGGTPMRRIARWNGSEWLPFGTGLDSTVRALAVRPNGDVVAGGDFATAGGIQARFLARWDGSQWFPFENGPNNSVQALQLLPNGDLVAGGGFARAGGVIVNQIARWDGTTWSPMGSGLSGTGAGVTSLLLRPNGDLLAGGGFSLSGTATVRCIARWNGAVWVPAAPNMSFPGIPVVYTLANSIDGDLLIGGDFALTYPVVSVYFAAYDFGDQPPGVVASPVSTIACDRRGEFTAHVTGSPAPTLQWQVRSPLDAETWISLQNTPTALSCGGSAVASAPNAPTCVITVEPCASVSSYFIRCAASNDCGASESTPASLVLCRAEINCDGVINSQDFFDFLPMLFDGSPGADVNSDGMVNSQDYFDFLNAFFEGCS